MINSRPRVLVISSVDPSMGPAVVGWEHYRVLKDAGLEVDFMTKYPVEGHPEVISVLGKSSLLFKKIRERFPGLFHLHDRIPQRPGFYFFYKKETDPPVPVKRVLDKVKKPYDVVHVVFWQEMLSFATIEALYDKLHCQFHFRCADYSPIAGGCHFMGDCLRYQSGCGQCPALCSNIEEDFTRWNIEYRKRVYEKVKPVVFGNSYMSVFFKKSYLLRNYDRLETVLPLVDVKKYSPQDRNSVRQKYAISPEKKFIVLIASQSLSDERKGFSYLLESLKTVYDALTASERDKVLLLIAGRNIDAIRESLHFDFLYLGYVNPADLPGIYSVADVFLSPSVNDAGPSMVNQALSCGTPIVSFEMGTALDLVKDKGTGYCAELRNSSDFAKGILSLFHLDDASYEKLREKCRQVALELTSDEAFFRNFIRVYEKYSEK